MSQNSQEIDWNFGLRMYLLDLEIAYEVIPKLSIFFIPEKYTCYLKKNKQKSTFLRSKSSWHNFFFKNLDFSVFSIYDKTIEKKNNELIETLESSVKCVHNTVGSKGTQMILLYLALFFKHVQPINLVFSMLTNFKLAIID